MVEGGPRPTSPASDVYTLLLVVATVFVVAGTVLIAVRSQALFGSWLPLGSGV